MRASLVLAALLVATTAHAQRVGPEVTSWIFNRGGETGHGGIPSNVQRVRYSDATVYVSCTCIPGYDIGPWVGNPNDAANQDFTFAITRAPQRNDGAKIETPLGHIGVWSNGVSVFNAKDARSYNNANVWHQNAIVVEAASFDTCLGHPAPNGEYHHHLNPRCLYDSRDGSRHSPIIGYAFDGFPIYGAYGFANTDGSGGVVRMRSGYRLRSISDRTTLAGGATLPAAQQGPAISNRYPLGYYTEDFEYVPGLGDLDEHNGRFSVTPEYPAGTYAYFVTLDESLSPAYPYTLGPTYYGTVPPGNTGPRSGHNTPSEPVVTYAPASIVDDSAIGLTVAPNPASERLSVGCSARRYAATIHDALGRLVLRRDDLAGETALDVGALAPGSYVVAIETADGARASSQVVVAR